MSRSVSYANNSVAVAYQHIEADEFDAQDEFDCMVEYITDTAKTLWPSFDKADKWLGREDHAILENRHAYIGISEYCGLVSVWLVPKDENNLSNNFCEQIKEKFLKNFGTLRRVGTFSNGESVFESLQSKPEKVA